MRTVPAAGSRWEKLGQFENDYKPQMWGFCKQFLAEDASGLAEALQRYVSAVQAGEAGMETPKLPTLISSSMTSMKEFDFANRNLSVEFLKTFISFLRRGPFNFVWDD